jgi:aspartate ammonia-lyase
MEKSNVITFLKGIELFRDLNNSELKKLAASVIEKQYMAGDYLFLENTSRENIYLIHTGEIELLKRETLGNEIRLALFSKGDFLGEGIWDMGSVHSTSARACTVSTVYEINHPENLKPATALKILGNVTRVMSQRMHNVNNQVLNLSAQYASGRTRTENDLLGLRDVPFEAYYGIQTSRASENFNITGVTLNFYPSLLEALSMVKEAAAEANCELLLLSQIIKDAIVIACREIRNGKLHNQFVVDMMQGGAGTSTNMNVNEVIANRALEILGREKGNYLYCHPNNHVNMSQSTNDAYPTSVKISLFNSNKKLVAALEELVSAFQRKSKEFSHVIKMGRTQLQDAVPMTLGQEFEAYSVTLQEEIERLNQNAKLFLEINLGATAIGTGINSHIDYADKALKHLRRISELDLVLAPDLIEATQDTGSFVMYSSSVKRLAIKLSKICNDLRLLSSGPRTGLNEIKLPPMQPGSSIMPGKINPVIPEVVNQIAFKVIGNDLTVTIASEAGQLELNVFEPVIVLSLFESIGMLINGMNTLRYRCIEGISANEDHCRDLVHSSIGLITALVPYIGYETSGEIAKEALENNKSVYELILAKGILDKEQLEHILSPENMIRPRYINELKKNSK